MPNALTQSPQAVDPLSWFGGPRLPLVFSFLAFAQGLVLTLLDWWTFSHLWLQFAALPFFLLSGYLIASFTKPHRARFGPPHAIWVLGSALLGLALSALGAAGGSVEFTRWWAPIAVAVIFAALAPYSSARQLIAYAVPLIFGVSMVGALVFPPPASAWVSSSALFATSPVLISAIGAIVFSYTVVSEKRALLVAADPIAHDPWMDEELHRAKRDHVVRMSARVAPFLKRIAETGVVSEDDRDLAGRLARQLRSDLVATVDSSWLDTLARERGFVVSDPDRLADGMNEDQRSALRGLLVAMLASPLIDRDRVLMELRSHDDGSTAVALSMDVDLPEGRRLMLVAPYYLTLKNTVDNLSWDDGRSLRLKFRVPAG